MAKHTVDGPAIIIDANTLVVVVVACSFVIVRFISGRLLLNLTVRPKSRRTEMWRLRWVRLKSTNILHPISQTRRKRSVSSQVDVKPNQIGVHVDPIQLSIFSHRFMSIAEQMGTILQRTSISTNIKVVVCARRKDSLPYFWITAGGRKSIVKTRRWTYSCVTLFA